MLKVEQKKSFRQGVNQLLILRSIQTSIKQILFGTLVENVQKPIETFTNILLNRAIKELVKPGQLLFEKRHADCRI